LGIFLCRKFARHFSRCEKVFSWVHLKERLVYFWAMSLAGCKRSSGVWV
jgi:hypothetical protein